MADRRPLVLVSGGLQQIATGDTVPLANGGTGATTATAARDALGAQLEPGTVAFTAAATPPSGWLKRNGAAVSRTTYAALFAAIGTTYGAGDGSTTFNVPEARGEFDRGWDDGRGIDTGRVRGSLQTDAFQGHRHQPPTGAAPPNTGVNPGVYIGVNYVNDVPTSAWDFNSGQMTPIAQSGFGTPRLATETRPRNVAYLAIIKY